MLEHALKAKLPIVGVVTDDILNYKAVIAALSGKPVADVPKSPNLVSDQDKIYVTDSMDQVTPDWYRRLVAVHGCMVVVNPAKSSPLMFEAGVLPTPIPLLKGYLEDALGAGVDVEELLPVLKGLSIRAAGEVIMLTQARTGNTTPKEVRRTRGMISTTIQGFTPLDTTYDFYEIPEELEDWLKLNAKYFTDPKIERLIPRGLLFDGPPGTGKSMAAKAIAARFGCPLYRLNVATVLDRFVGQSEARIEKILALCEREAPCVLLIDEVEKLFGDDGEAGVITRLLSQLLWWLSEHRSQVFTVMTTNDVNKIPAELYRSGRLDGVMHLPRMKPQPASLFAIKALSSILGKKPTLNQSQLVSEIVKATGNDMSQIEVINLVIKTIKQKNWL